MSSGLPSSHADYVRGVLRRADVADDDPMRAVRAWIDDAVDAEVEEPTAAVLSTVDADGLPDGRVVLVRDVDEDGAVWYSNRRSAKGRQLEVTPMAALTWFWPQLERQVRLRGAVEAVDDEVSDSYWEGRPRDAQLAAVASDQSLPIEGRPALEARFAAQEAAHPPEQPVPRPAHWGGSRLRPVRVELWQGRPGRLHDRLAWTRQGAGWRLERLMP